MKISKKAFLLTTFLGISTAAVAIPLSITLTSCSNASKSKSNLVYEHNNNPVINLYNDYLEDKNTIITSENLSHLDSPNGYHALNSSQVKYLGVVSNLYLEKFNKMLSNSKLNLTYDQLILLNSIISNLENQIKAVQNNLEWLGCNVANISNCFPLSASNNYVIKLADESVNVIWKNNPTHDLSLVKDANVVDCNNKCIDFVSWINQLKINLQEGLSHNVVPSLVQQRLFISSLLRKFYSNELNYWASNAEDAKNITIKEFIDGPENVSQYPKTQFFYQYKSQLQKIYTGTNPFYFNMYSNSIENAQEALNDFVKFYVGTYFKECCENSDIGYGGSTRPILSKTNASNDEEVEDTYYDPNTNEKIYGLGLSKVDLDAKNIGLSYMKNDNAKNIYKTILEVNSGSKNIDFDKLNQFNKAKENTTLSSMKSTVNSIVDLQTNHLENEDKSKAKDVWKVSINNKDVDLNYVSNPNDSTSSEELSKNLSNFQKYLDTNKFVWNDEVSKETINALLGNDAPDGETLKSLNITQKQYNYWKSALINSGYFNKWNIPNNEFDGYNTQALLCNSFIQYANFDNLLSNYLNLIKSTNLSSTLENVKILPRVLGNNFMNNVSMTTSDTLYVDLLPNDQLNKVDSTATITRLNLLKNSSNLGMYAVDINQKIIPDKQGLVNKNVWNNLPNVYLQNVSLYETKPLESWGIIPGDKYGSSLENIKTFQNGLYWQDTQANLSLEDNPNGWTIANQYANLLQYYGYLNQVQLSNLSTETALAINGVTSDSGNEITNGCSIADVRNYIKNNVVISDGLLDKLSLYLLTSSIKPVLPTIGDSSLNENYKLVNDKFASSNSSLISNPLGLNKFMDLYFRDTLLPIDVVNLAVEKSLNYIIDSKKPLWTTTIDYENPVVTIINPNAPVKKNLIGWPRNLNIYVPKEYWNLN